MGVSRLSGLLAIINDILDFSKIEAGRLELEGLDYDLAELVKSAALLAALPARQKGLHFEYSLDPEIPTRVYGDPLRLRQVLLNLASNAVKLTAAGAISIRGALLEETGTEIRVGFTVRDSGIGIPDSAMDLLFQPFSQVDGSTTRRFGGTGLGLAICKQLVELMGGSIEVASRIGTGSTFSFSTVLQKASDEGTSITPVSAIGAAVIRSDLVVDPICPGSRGGQAVTAGPSPATILVVEDNAVNRRVARAMLESLGYAADSVDDGRRAVEAATSGRYDLILMDCQMPEMDGLEATRRIRALEQSGRRVTIVALTANAMTGDRDRCPRAGMDDYLTKPMRQHELKEMLERWAA